MIPTRLNLAAWLLDARIGEGRGERIAIRPAARTFSYVDVARRSAPVHPGLEPGTRFVAQVLEVALHRLDRLNVANWAVPRHYDGRVQRNDEVAGGDPVGQRTGPDHRMPFLEQ